jgi:hypothetical protein
MREARILNLGDGLNVLNSLNDLNEPSFLLP